MEKETLILYGVITLIVLGVFAILLFIILKSEQDRKNLEGRLGRLKKGYESSEDLFINLREETLPDIILNFVRKHLNALRNLNKTSAADYRLMFEKCGWDPGFATLIIPVLKVFSLVVFMVGYYDLITYNARFAAFPPAGKLFLAVGFVVVGFKFVNLVFEFLAKQRLKRIQKDFSLVIDLLVVCTESGLSFDRSLEKIAQEIIHQNADLARELTVVAAELSILPERRLAYENFAKRLPLEIIKSLSIGLIQAEEHGAAVGKTLTVLSQDFLHKRMSLIEETVGKIGPKMTVPMVVFGVPIIMIMVLGPSFTKIKEGLGPIFERRAK